MAVGLRLLNIGIYVDGRNFIPERQKSYLSVNGGCIWVPGAEL